MKDGEVQREAYTERKHECLKSKCFCCRRYVDSQTHLCFNPNSKKGSTRNMVNVVFSILKWWRFMTRNWREECLNQIWSSFNSKMLLKRFFWWRLFERFCPFFVCGSRKSCCARWVFYHHSSQGSSFLFFVFYWNLFRKCSRWTLTFFWWKITN